MFCLRELKGHREVPADTESCEEVHLHVLMDSFLGQIFITTGFVNNVSLHLCELNASTILSAWPVALSYFPSDRYLFCLMMMFSGKNGCWAPSACHPGGCNINENMTQRYDFTEKGVYLKQNSRT